MVERTLISFPSQLQLIERLQHLLYLSSSMIFISGEQGSGKSTLVEQLSNQLPDNTQQAFISLYELTSAVQIRQKIISQLFEQPLFDADDTLVDILLLLKKNQDPGIARVIVIDNAELLPAQFISELVDVIKQKSLLSNNEINFILLSEPASNKQMVSVANGSQKNQNVATLTFKLAPLNAHEALQLLNHRFTQIGYSPQIEHKDALAKQLSYCNGIPETILSLAAELSGGDVTFNDSSWLKTRFPAILLMLLLFVIAGSLAIYLYPKLIKDKIEVKTIVETESDLLPEIATIELIVDSQSEVTSSEQLAGKWSTNDEPQINDNQLSVGEADNQERIIISEQQLLELVASEEKVHAVAIDPNVTSVISEKQAELPVVALKPVVVAELAKINIAVIEKPTVLVVESIVQPDVPNAPLAPSIVETESALLATVALTSSEIDEVHEVFVLPESVNTQTTTQVEILESVTALILTEKIDNDAFTPASTLFSINEKLFTLQLLAMGTEKSLQAFITEHQLPRDNVYLYKTLRDKKPWYVVIYGQFENRYMANLAANNLPGTLSNLDSWVKEYALVHQELQLNE